MFNHRRAERALRYFIGFSLAVSAYGALAFCAKAQTITVEELPGEPFAKITVVNVCGDANGRHTVQTSRGPVVLEYTENENGCSSAPDTIEAVELPPEVAAVPPFLDLIERPNSMPSDPGFIWLYTYRGL